MRSKLGLLIIALGLLVAGCSAEKVSVVGKYERINGLPQATLELRKDGTFTVCILQRPCESGRYNFEPHADEAWDRIFFYGKAMRVFDESGWAIVEYGGYCPCLYLRTFDMIDFRRVWN